MAMDLKNLILIGMPGSGKSTVGVLAAKALGLDFVDTDLLLQKQERRRLPELLELGTELFLQTENRLLSSLRFDGAVIATGGSAVYHETGMRHLRSLGRAVWLDVAFAELERRLGDLAARGVVLAPGQTLRALYDERRPLYERWADVRLSVRRESLDVTASRLAGLFQKS